MKKVIVQLKTKEEEEKLKGLLNNHYFDEVEDYDEVAVGRKMGRKIRLMASVALGLMLLLGAFTIWQMEELDQQQGEIKRLESESLWQKEILKSVRDSLLVKEKALYDLKNPSPTENQEDKQEDNE